MINDDIHYKESEKGMKCICLMNKAHHVPWNYIFSISNHQIYNIKKKPYR